MPPDAVGFGEGEGTVFIASVTDRRPAIVDWKSFLREAFGEWGIRLLDDGVAWIRDEPVARYELLDVDEVRRRSLGAPWLEAHPGCEFIGPTLGFFGWTPGPEGERGASEEANESIAIAAIKEGRGVVARSGGDHFRFAVHRRRLSLGEAVGKYGFDDGGDLLCRDRPDYVDAVCREVGRCLASAGFEECFWWAPTHHNPLRWWPGTTGELAIPPPEVQDRLFIEIWVYDFDLLGNPMFRGHHDPDRFA